MVIGFAERRYHRVPASKAVRNRGTPVKQRCTAKLIARVNLIISIPQALFFLVPRPLATPPRTSRTLVAGVLGNDYADRASGSVTFAFLSGSGN